MIPQEFMTKALKTKSNSFTGVKPDLVHGIVGIASESGELSDLLKKMFFHPQKHVDRDKIVDEVGDILWYVALTLYSVGATFEEAFDRNIAKLTVRHEKNNGEKDRQAELQAQLNVSSRA